MKVIDIFYLYFFSREEFRKGEFRSIGNLHYQFSNKQFWSKSSFNYLFPELEYFEIFGRMGERFKPQSC